MHAFFDSPETIRNKVKEFKTATLGGLNKQDVMNYLSLLSEQQGVMIRLLRENNIPLYVDDGYEQEEMFVKPDNDGHDYLSQYLGGESGDIVAEMQAEIEALKVENEQLRLVSLNSTSTQHTQEVSLTDFDTQYGTTDSVGDDKNELIKSIKEKELYIKELENEVQNLSNSNSNLNLLEDNNSLSDVERQAYEEEIINLRTQLELANSSTENTDLFNTEVVTIDEDVKASYEREIESLKIQLEEAQARSIELDNTTTESTLEPFEINSFDENASNEEIERLNSTIDTLTSEIAVLKSEIKICNELLDEHAKAEEARIEANENSVQEVKDSATLAKEQNDADNLESLKATIEILELEISKKDKEKAAVEFKLDDLSAELDKYKNFRDENGELISLDPESLKSQYNNILESKKSILAEKQEVESKIEALKEKEAMIEANKLLVSEDYVNSITTKEKEITNLRNQMDKMLIVAQATADNTVNEAKVKATNLIEEADSKAASIIETATNESNRMTEEATSALESANKLKSDTEQELAKFREETRQSAEEMVMEAQSKADEVLNAAQEEAQKIQDSAMEEVENITAQAEQRISEIDDIIQSKQKEIDNMQKYYLKVKNDGLVAVKKLYNQLENIIYSDELS